MRKLAKEVAGSLLLWYEFSSKASPVRMSKKRGGGIPYHLGKARIDSIMI